MLSLIRSAGVFAICSCATTDSISNASDDFSGGGGVSWSPEDDDGGSSSGAGGPAGEGGLGVGAGGFGGEGAGGLGGATVGSCGCGVPTVAGALEVSPLDEVSGMVASKHFDGLFYLVEDHGNDPVLYGVSQAGQIQVEIGLVGVDPHDIEDIARGPCGTSTCLFLADTGDNDEDRAEYSILSMLEPDSLGNGSTAPSIQTFQYEDGPHNVEALVVDPISGMRYLITKTKFTPSLYRLAPGATVAIKAFDLPALSGLVVSGASLRDDGGRLLVRTETELLIFDGVNVEDALSHPSCGAALDPTEATLYDNVEAVAFFAEGESYAMVSEGVQAPFRVAMCD